MGAIRKVVSDLDPVNDVEREQIELIEALASLASAKADTLLLEVLRDINEAGSEFNKSIPVETYLDKRIETHAYSSSSIDVVETVAESIKDFIGGGSENIINGIGSLLGKAVDIFLGTGEASEDTLERYVVYTNGFGIERLDLKVWKRKVKASGIKNKVQCVSAFVGIRSAVNVSKVQLNTFAILYSEQLKKMGIEESELEKALDKAKSILDKFHDHSVLTDGDREIRRMVRSSGFIGRHPG